MHFNCYLLALQRKRHSSCRISQCKLLTITCFALFAVDTDPLGKKGPRLGRSLNSRHQRIMVFIYRCTYAYRVKEADGYQKVAEEASRDVV